jgi:hypothetical protein
MGPQWPVHQNSTTSLRRRAYAPQAPSATRMPHSHCFITKPSARRRLQFSLERRKVQTHAHHSRPAATRSRTPAQGFTRYRRDRRCALAGLMAALALSRAGVRVTLLERSDDSGRTGAARFPIVVPSVVSCTLMPTTSASRNMLLTIRSPKSVSLLYCPSRCSAAGLCVSADTSTLSVSVTVLRIACSMIAATRVFCARSRIRASAPLPAALSIQAALLPGTKKKGSDGLHAQYDLGSPRTFSAMKQRISCGLTGARRGIHDSRR